MNVQCRSRLSLVSTLACSSLTLIHMLKNLQETWHVGFVYGSMSLVAMVFVYFIVPELKGRSLEELDELFQALRQLASALQSHKLTI